MPCHLTSHWALLVYWVKEQRWEYYDSLQSSLHHGGVRANVCIKKATQYYIVA
ncbi:hypothetical protein KSP40_PGU010709 [Platanthera guangdongensis]|uniref:Ubiquitin-like protease family profile domain-containing protein n=1 Tax=Platanthera guangdongensis TaxID=2320717 RepID=A0ABR2MUT3_9ASPA